MTALEHALDAAGRGYRIVPCKGKVAVTPHGVLDATSDPGEIRALFKRYRNKAYGVTGGVIIDLDVKPEVDGVREWNKLVAGKDCPATRTVRTPGGGVHLYFRTDARYGNPVGRLAPGIDVRAHNAYVIGPGSVTDKGVYTLEADGDPAELPDWLAARLTEVAEGEQRSIAGVHELLAGITYRPDPIANSVLAMECEFIGELPEGKRHAEMLEVTWNLAAMVFAGRLKHEQVLEYGDAYARACQPYPVGKDFSSALLGAYQKIGEPDTGSPGNLPGEFWESTDVLTHIRDAAWNWYRSPDALLHAVLARLAAMNPPQRQAATGIGKPASLNYAAVLAGPPGSGKSTACSCAEELLPFPLSVDVREGGLGSGEGLAELYMDGIGKDRQQAYHNGFIYEDEGAALSELKDRSGATLWSTIRKAISGETLGQANATKDRSRRVEKGTYSLGLLIGFQPETIQPLLSETGSGMAQRFAYASATDPSIPDAGPEWPGPLEYRARQQVITFDAEVSAAMRADVLTRVRGGTAEGDEHAMLTRARLAALLVILHGGDHVDGKFWELAGQMWDTSCEVRESLRQAGKDDADRKERWSHEQAARREVAKARAVENDATERAVKNAARYLKAHPGASDRDVWNSLYSKLRKQVDKAEVFERLRA